MFSKVFLAQTSREMEEFQPERTAYMACHFSASGKGLSNCPQALPSGSILLLDDSMPVQGHDPVTVTEQLQDLIGRFSIKAVLLDFQREWTAETDNMAAALQALPCPVAAPPVYAKGRACPVFLPPPPVNKALNAYLQPWLKRGVFLEIAPDAIQITVTEKGSVTAPLPCATQLPLENAKLHCHYNAKVLANKAVFTLCRTGQDLTELAQEAYRLGVLGVVGLYQELHGL